MTQTEALRLALEALEKMQNAIYNIGGEHAIDLNFAIEQADVSEEAITAIKAALLSRSDGEAKDEPVAHSVVAGALFDFMGWLTSREKRLILSSVDEASPAVEAITEFAKKRNLSLKYAEVGYWMEFLSTPPQQEAKDEPVATKNSDGVTLHLGWDDLPVGTKLYTTSPQCTWVGLTDEEIDALDYSGTRIEFVRAIETKLKDLNT